MAKTTLGHHDFARRFTRRDFLSKSLKTGAAAFTTGLLPRLNSEAVGCYNVLFIIADDLRPLLGCYGYSEMYTPNIDRLAERGTLFKRAYCQYPLCNPSRASMITGLRPETLGIYDNSTGFRDVLPEVVTLPQHFKTHGYHTRSFGKIAHAHRWRDEFSWSAPIWDQQSKIDEATIPSWQMLDIVDGKLIDSRIASAAVETLYQIKDQQFFLAVGFNKPHLPYNVPRKYYDLYDIGTFKSTSSVVPPPQNDLRAYADIPNGDAPISEEKTLELMRGYAASTSYMDSQVGRVLDQLDALRLTENTVIAFCGDHGFHLGEHGIWGKNTLFEVGVHSPLIVSIPGQQPNQTDALAELVDLYPTLCDACQLPVPPQLEGLSLMPVIEQPASSWKVAAFSQFKRDTGIHVRSMRTTQYRYTEWKTNRFHRRELYDYDRDPGGIANITHHPESKKLIALLSEQLRAGWRGALPDVQGRLRGTQTVPWDINCDGIIDNRDLVLVSNSFGKETPEHPKVDVNKDGKVDIVDLLIVAVHFGESGNSAAPSTHVKIFPEHLSLVEEWLTEARLADDGSPIFRRGIATLEHLINTGVPTETLLLPNYPNPFNPETWIPYDLAEAAEVYIHIYDTKGESVRQLSLGFQTTGTYRTRSRAAYWDGRNSAGEAVASGVYFYTLQAEQFRATRRMMILK